MKKYLIFALFYFQALLAQVQFETKVSKTTLGINETLRVDFFMNIDGDNFLKPTFKGFNIVGGPSQSVSQLWVNGKSSFEKTYTYYLKPTQTGNIVIKPAEIEYDSKIYKTNPVEITVTTATENPKSPDDPDYSPVSTDDNLYLVADISNANPYLNEPITVVYKLYFSYSIGIDNWQELSKPTYNNFWSQNIDIKQLVAEEGFFKQQKFRFVVLKKTVLYPQKTGSLTIEPLTLDIDVQLPTNRVDVFGRPFTRKDHKKVSAGGKTINVKALPEKKKPTSFDGAVGSFDFKALPSKTVLKEGESLELVLSVSGKGNLKLFNLPKLEAANALEIYDPVHKEQINTTLSGMTGTISDTYTIIPQFKGDYKIKPMVFSYFDLETKSYKSIVSKEIDIKVLESPAVANADGNSTKKEEKKIFASTEQFQFIKLKTDLKPIEKTDFLGSKLYFTLLFLPILMLPLIVFFKKKKDANKNDVFRNKTRANNQLSKKHLSEAKKQIGNKELFYIALEKAMHNFLKAKLHIETSEMSKENIKNLLLSKKVKPETITDFISLTENCEFARYTPFSSTEIHNDFEKAIIIISELEKQIV